MTMRGQAMMAVAAGFLLLAPAPAMAISTLTFDGNICDASGVGACSNGNQIGASHGSTAQLAISYRSINTTTNAVATPHLNFWSTGYGNLSRVVYGGSNPTNFRSEILFAPASGFEVRLIDFAAGCYLNRASCRTMRYTVDSFGGTAIAAGTGIGTLHPASVNIAINSGWFADGIKLTWGPDGYDVGLDNIRFDVRPVASGGVVPEPASWAMLIAGFGLTGAVSRRRRRSVVA